MEGQPERENTNCLSKYDQKDVPGCTISSVQAKKEFYTSLSVLFCSCIMNAFIYRSIVNTLFLQVNVFRY